jgi:hypothetical protein
MFFPNSSQYVSGGVAMEIAPDQGHRSEISNFGWISEWVTSPGPGLSPGLDFVVAPI